MPRTFHLLLCAIVLCLQAACQRRNTSEIAQGTYKLTSAVLNQAGKFRELNCTGEFEFSLEKKIEGYITLEGIGQAKCAAEHPASFEELFGGECSLTRVNFFNNGESESYIHNGSPLTCFASSDSQVRVILQPINSKVIRLTRISSSEAETSSEVLFERISDDL